MVSMASLLMSDMVYLENGKVKESRAIIGPEETGDCEGKAGDRQCGRGQKLHMGWIKRVDGRVEWGDMPVHDWTRVGAGTFHAFHNSWISQIQLALNSGVLPDGYYALAEQVAGQVIPDVLTLQNLGSEGSSSGAAKQPSDWEDGGGIALATAPPKVSQTDKISEAMLLAARQRRIVIRHSTGDRVVALLEIVSPGNKEARGAIENFVDKAVGALAEGMHLLVVDLFPPGTFDPAGTHGAIWKRLGSAFSAQADKPLTLSSYRAAKDVTCYVESLAVGTALTDMPLFLDPDHYVNIPLEKTYVGAYQGIPKRWKTVIEE